jgi:uncharacterized protein YjiS (DUF1127 family)
MFHELRKRYRLWRDYRNTYDELERLDAHMLRDLGCGEPSRRGLEAFARCHAVEAHRCA